jgi:hypothetical protein
MTPQILVEISLPPAGTVPAGRIMAAYKASRFGQIALLLNGVSAASVNKVLDPIVPTMPLDTPGLIYVDASDGTRLQRLFADARMLVASTAWLRAAAVRAGVKVSRSIPAERAAETDAERTTTLTLVVNPPPLQPLGAAKLPRKPRANRRMAIASPGIGVCE